MASSDAAASWVGQLGTPLSCQGLRTGLSLIPPKPAPLSVSLVCDLWLTAGPSVRGREFPSGAAVLAFREHLRLLCGPPCKGWVRWRGGRRPADLTV